MFSSVLEVFFFFLRNRLTERLTERRYWILGQWVLFHLLCLAYRRSYSTQRYLLGSRARAASSAGDGERGNKTEASEQAGVYSRLRSSPDKPALPSLFVVNAWSIVNKIDKLRLRIHSNSGMNHKIPDAAIASRPDCVLSGPISRLRQRKRWRCVHICE